MPVTLTKDDFYAVLQSLMEAQLGLGTALSSRELPDALPEELASIAARFFDLPGKTLAKNMDSLKSLTDAVVQAVPSPLKSLIFQTSGSTGEPTFVPQNYALLSQEIKIQALIYEGRQRIVSLVPRHHMYGFLFGVMLPRTMGIPVCYLPPIPTQAFIDHLMQGDLVIGFPLFWTGLKNITPSFPKGIRCITSTGPCPPQIIETLIGHGVDLFYELYGSSETGGIGWRTATDEPYTLFTHLRRGSRDDQLIRTMPEGDEQIYDLPDALDWFGINRCTPIARKDKAVQVAGVNVYPAQVVRVIREHHWIAECAVRQDQTHAARRLKAFLVPTPDAPGEAELLASVRNFLAKHLTAPQTPRRFSIGKTLPQNAIGKLCDWD